MTPATTHPDTPVITAWSVASAFGLGREAFSKGIWEGKAPDVAFDAEAWQVPDAEALLVPDLDLRVELGRKGIRKMDRLTGMTLAVTKRLVKGPDGERLLPADDETGFVLGTTAGSVQAHVNFIRDSYTQERPFYVDAGGMPSGVMNGAAGASAIWYGFKGPNSTIAGGRASGLFALGYARRLLRTGRASRVLCGAVEEYSTARAWLEHHARSLEKSDSVVLGEGCGIMLVERAETATRPVLAAMLGVETRVALDGEIEQAVRDCVLGVLETSEVKPDEVWAVCPSAAAGSMGEAERSALTELFSSARLATIPSLGVLGETWAASVPLQLAAVLSVAERAPSIGRVALVTVVDRDGVVGATLLRLFPEASAGEAA